MCWIRTKLVAAAVVWALATGAATRSCSLGDFSKLVSGLSSEAEVYYPGSAQFTQYSDRWSSLDAPTVNVTVLPAIEADVVQIVRAARKCNIPFLAYNGAHGSVTTLGRMQWGIDINLSKLSGVAIAADGQTATISGGTNSKVVVDALWAAGRQTVTPICECVSYMGPALGGGHGWLQGHYGLVADQLVSMRLVLADGTLTTVDASSDLMWAMAGAGHNFGIVTSATVKIYPSAHANWALETLTFTGDKVKALYQAANDHFLRNGPQPVGLIHWSYWFNNPQVDPSGPIIQFFLIQEGVSAVDSAYTQPFHALGPVSVASHSGTYQDLAGWLSITLASPPCQMAGMANPLFPIYLPAYNATAQQELYSLFAAATSGSSPFATSFFLFEGYSTQGVAAVDPASTAFAFRGDRLLIAPLIQYAPAGPERDQQAAQLGNQLRQILHAGSGRRELHTYVNYAYGDETTEQWYGYEKWRQVRLRVLKAKYDPRGSFSFYAPVA